MFCNHCGTEIPENSSFCTKCGMNIEAKKSEPIESVSKKPSSDAIGAERSKIVFIWSIIIAVITGIIGAASGAVFFGILCAISVLVATFSFVALIRYIEDIPYDERTSSQEKLLTTVRVVFSIFAALAIGFLIISLIIANNS